MLVNSESVLILHYIILQSFVYCTDLKGPEIKKANSFIMHVRNKTWETSLTLVIYLTLNKCHFNGFIEYGELIILEKKDKEKVNYRVFL